jgi:16S rRNA (cytidine1402-2'-O)-methyltransferase
VTLRALKVLRSVDLVAAEDTRIARQLLAHFDIDKTVLALHRHNERQACARVLDALRAGKSIALTTDAGTPSVSDPGSLLVETIRDAGFEAFAVPGPSALTAAWSVSGISGPGFLFHGFLPAQQRERRRVLAGLERIPYALVFYEAPHRVIATARDLCVVLGEDRRIVVARELTKLFESVHATTLKELEAWLAADPNRSRGELVLIVAGAAQPQSHAAQEVEETLRALLEELPPAQAARIAARVTGASRAELYQLAIAFRARR